MKIAIKVLVVLLAVLIVAAGVAWYMLGHGGQLGETNVPTANIAPARQLLSDLKTNSSLKFSMAVPRSFDWYRRHRPEQPNAADPLGRRHDRQVGDLGRSCEHRRVAAPARFRR